MATTTASTAAPATAPTNPHYLETVYNDSKDMRTSYSSPARKYASPSWDNITVMALAPDTLFADEITDYTFNEYLSVKGIDYSTVEKDPVLLTRFIAETGSSYAGNNSIGKYLTENNGQLMKDKLEELRKSGSSALSTSTTRSMLPTIDKYDTDEDKDSQEVPKKSEPVIMIVPYYAQPRTAIPHQGMMYSVSFPTLHPQTLD